MIRPARAFRALLLACLATLAAPAFAATFAGVTVPEPLPPRPVTETFWGTAVEDRYRYFEDTKDAALQAWMKANAQATETILSRIPGRAGLLARMRENEAQAPGLATQIVRTANSRYFFEKRDPKDNQFRLVWRAGPDGPDQLIFDPEDARAQDGHAARDHGLRTVARRPSHRLCRAGRRRRDRHAARRRPRERQGAPPADRPHPLRQRVMARRWQRLLLRAPARGLREAAGGGALQRPRHALRRTRCARGRPARSSAPATTPTSSCPSTPRGTSSRSRARRSRRRWSRSASSATSCSISPTSTQRSAGTARWRQVVAKDDQVAEVWPAGGLPLRPHVEGRAALSRAAHAALQARPREGSGRGPGERERGEQDRSRARRALRRAPRRRHAVAVAAAARGQARTAPASRCRSRAAWSSTIRGPTSTASCCRWAGGRARSSRSIPAGHRRAPAAAGRERRARRAGRHRRRARCA